MTGLLADADALLMEIQRKANPGLLVVETMPPDIPASVPFFKGNRISGGALHGRFWDRAVFSWLVIGPEDTDVAALAEHCRDAFYLAWETQFPYTAGSVQKYREVAGPRQQAIPGQPDGMTTYQALTELQICPPLAV